MWLKHLGVVAAPLRVQCFQETIWRLSHLDTLFVALAKRAADVAKTHSCESSHIHQSNWLVCTRAEMAKKQEPQTAGKLDTVFIWVK